MGGLGKSVRERGNSMCLGPKARKLGLCKKEKERQDGLSSFCEGKGGWT